MKNTNVFSLSKAGEAKESRRRAVLHDIFNTVYSGEITIADDGRIDDDFALPWQAQVDALGLNVQVTSLVPQQFLKLTTAISIWGFIIQERLKSRDCDLDRLENTPRNTYIKSILAGKPGTEPVPDELQQSVTAIVAMSKSDMPPLPGSLRLVPRS